MIFCPQTKRKSRNKAFKGFFDNNFIYKENLLNLYQTLELYQRDFDDVLIIGIQDIEQIREIRRLTKAKNLYLADFAENFLAKENSILISPDFYPFAENSFDLVFSPLMYHSNSSLQSLLKNINTSLKKEGISVISLFSGNNLMNVKIALASMGIDRIMIQPFYNPQDLSFLLQSLHFKNPIIDIENYLVDYKNLLSTLKDIKLCGENNLKLNFSVTRNEYQKLLKSNEIRAEIEISNLSWHYS